MLPDTALPRAGRGAADGDARRTLRGSPPGWLGAALALGGFAALVWLENRRPLRRRRQPLVPRLLRNTAMAALSAAAVQLAERPLVDPLAKAVAARRLGLLPRLHLPRWQETSLAVAAMDYTLYLWHVLLHRSSLLWRCHQVHHIDLDLDASTAIRFHFAELVLSVPWRAGQVLLLGVGPRPLRIWRRMLMLSVLFHHSNLRLPEALERRLRRLVMTPPLHGIHHSDVAEETDSNFSSGLVLWDHLHGTWRADVPQETIRIGVPGGRQPERDSLPAMLALPFERRPPVRSWSGEVCPK